MATAGRITAYLSKLLLFLALLTGCSAERSSERLLRINFESDIPSTDPRLARNLISTAVSHMLFEGLSRLNPEGKWEWALAEQVRVSEGGKRYEIDLRPSVWSNGDPVTAADFVETWRSILSPAFPSDMAHYLFAIRGAREAKTGAIPTGAIGCSAPTDRTIVIELTHPLPYFPELLAMPVFFPVHPQNRSNPATPIIGNGPFFIAEWKPGDSLIFRKNPRYWEAESVYLDGICATISSPNAELQMFENQALDWAGSPLSTLPADAISHFAMRGELKSSPLTGTCFIRANTSPTWGGNPNPLADATLRQALSSAVDREQIASHVLQGGQKAAFSLVPPEMGLNTPFSPDQAVVGSFDRRIEVTLSFAPSDRNLRIAQVIQKLWEEKLGIHVILEAVEPKTLFRRIAAKDYQLAIGSWIADFNDPINFLSVFKLNAGSANNTGWENPEYIALLERSQVCEREEERRQLMRDAEEILLRQAPIIPLFHFSMNFLQNPHLKGVSISPLAHIDFRWARFSEEVER
jgi:oligopeptide transport system substrate-binding protein